MQTGMLSQGGKQGISSRFAHQLSFETLYRNSIHLESFEDKLVQTDDAKATMDLPLINEHIDGLNEVEMKMFATIKSHVKGFKK